MQKLRAEALRVLDTQLELIKFFGSDYGRRFMQGFVWDMVSKENLPTGFDDPREYADETGKLLASNLEVVLNMAETFYVTEDMLALNLHAAEDVAMTPFTPDDLPSTHGFVLLPRPVIVRGVHNKRVSARALAWWTGNVDVKTTVEDEDAWDGDIPLGETPALFFALFSNKNDWHVDDHIADEYHNHKEKWLTEPQWAMMHWMPIHFGRAWAPTDIEEWPVLTTEFKDDDGYVNPGLMYNWLAFLKSFFLLVKQEIAVVSPTHPDRHAYRRWKGTGLMPEFGDIKIITLRRKRPRHEDETPGGTEVEWSHRWIVSGFWRKKPYHPSCPDCSSLGHACGHHEEKWIESFEKGPPDKPLIIKDKVFVWKR